MHYVYKPADWWRQLYWYSPAQYYSKMYCKSIGVFCGVCQNEGAPYTCAGWDEDDLATVEEATRPTWVCPRCIGTDKHKEQQKPF